MGILGGRQQEEPVLACPRDGKALDKTRREGVTIDGCPDCGGFWFDSRELARVAGDDEVERLARRVGEFAQFTALTCPRDGTGCVAAHVGQIEVDTCPKCHGVWLDRWELESARREVATKRILAGARPGLPEFLSRL